MNASLTVSPQRIQSGQKAIKPIDPIRTGYTFGGWYKESGLINEFIFATETITSDITLYAKWTLKTYFVSFNTDGGSDVQRQIVPHGNKVTKPADPIKRNFIFEGWYKEQSSTTTFNFNTEKITSDVILYAKWGTAITEARITAFSFSKRVNPDMSLHDDENTATGTIDQTARTITVAASAYIYIDNLKKPSFTASTGATVSVGTTAQASEVTEQDFTSPIIYTVISEDGIITKDYVVRVARDTFASIPDDNFRSGLKRLLPDAFNTGDRLNTAHNSLASFTTFDYPSTTDFIEYMKGVEFLTALKNLSIRTNALKELDVSRNVNLNTLQIYSTQSGKLTALDLSHNTALTILSCPNNELKQLDLSHNTALITLSCPNNELKQLDLSHNIALTTLSCNNNKLTQLDVSKNTALTQIYCNNNELTTLDVSKNIALTSLNCADNELTALDMTGMHSILFLIISAGTEKNPLSMFKVFDAAAVKQNAEVKEVKTDRADAVTISTYSYDAATNTYTEVCANYNPNDDSCP